MAPLEKLFRLELDYRTRLRQLGGTDQDVAVYADYSTEHDYPTLVQQSGKVSARDIDRIHQRYLLASDPRDTGAARDGLFTIFNLWPR